MEETAKHNVQGDTADVQSVAKEEMKTDTVVADDKEIYRTLVITDEIGSEPKVFTGAITFSVIIDKEKDDVKSVEGIMTTDIFFENTEIYQLDSWRFCLNHVSIKEIQCDTMTDDIKYFFTAKTFATKA